MVTRLKQANESVQSSYEDMQARLENQHTVQRFLGQKFRVKQDELREVQQLWISFLHTCMCPHHSKCRHAACAIVAVCSLIPPLSFLPSVCPSCTTKTEPETPRLVLKPRMLLASYSDRTRWVTAPILHRAQPDLDSPPPPPPQRLLTATRANPEGA